MLSVRVRLACRVPVTTMVSASAGGVLCAMAPLPLPMSKASVLRLKSVSLGLRMGYFRKWKTG